MNKDKIKEELDWILHQVQNKADIYLIADVIPYKEYATKDVHEWAAEYDKDVGIQNAYNKIKDVLEARIFKGINAEAINPALGLKALGEFFVRTQGDKGEGAIGQIKVEILALESGV